MASVSGSVMTKREPLPRVELHFDGAAELLDVPAHHVHADAAAGDVGGLLGGGEAGQEDQLVDLLVGQRVVRADQAARARLREDAVRVQAAAVIAHFDGDVAALVIRVEVHGAVRRLAGGHAHVGHFDAVVDAVAHQVHQRIADLLQHRLVELGLLAGHLQVDLLAEALLRSRTMRGKRLNTKLMGSMRTRMTLSCSSRTLRSSCARPERNCSAACAFELRAQLAQHGLRDDQLADGVHQLVDLLDADADRAAVADAACFGASAAAAAPARPAAQRRRCRPAWHRAMLTTLEGFASGAGQRRHGAR